MVIIFYIKLKVFRKVLFVIKRCKFLLLLTDNFFLYKGFLWNNIFKEVIYYFGDKL